ncbi:MAG: GTP 3',8-cyclase MoaA [Actinomycetia bacterium]|nr:GTP 3',8-cyclase MoaA [Actinomycetes bacterium]
MTHDSHGRKIDYLRISVTDRCNLRCLYCMPDEGVAFKPHSDILSIEEITAFVEVAATCGISRIRLTGGEPLVRKGILDLVANITALPGLERVAMTSNGILLAQMAESLKAAGLKRVNISLDSLDPGQYAAITRRGRIDDVYAGLEAALACGFNPVKVNVVVVRSLHQDLLAFARLSLDRPLHVRFIEYMPVGNPSGANSCGWTNSDTIPNDEMVEQLDRASQRFGLGNLIPLNSKHEPEGWGPARYYQLPGASGTIGFISALSRHFCAECNRLRLTADGKLRPCLFSDTELDVRAALRAGDKAAVKAIIQTALRVKPKEHGNRIGTERNMSQIGG